MAWSGRARSIGAAGTTALILLACEHHAPIVKAPAPVPSAAPVAASAWQTSWLPASVARGTAGIPRIEDPVNGVCRSHAGCEDAARSLPVCTSVGPLPSGFVHLRGRLEVVPGPVLSPEDVLSCAFQPGHQRLATDSARFELGLGCSGDRTGWCCPYGLGTNVQIVGRTSAESASVPTLDEYWLCADAGQAAPAPPLSVVASVAPKLIDLGESPGTIAWTTAQGLAVWTLSEPAPIALKQANAAPFSCISVAPGGQAAFSIDGTGQATLWSLPRATKLLSVERFAQARHAERIEPDVSCSYLLSRKLEWSHAGDRLLTVQGDSTVRLWDVARATQIRLEPLHRIETTHDGYFSPDGQTLLIPMSGGELELRRADDGRVLAHTRAGAGRFAPDQGQVLVDDGSAVASPVRLWQPANGALRVLLDDGCGAQSGAGGRLVVAASPCDSGRTVVLDAASGRRLFDRQHDRQFRPLLSSTSYAAPRFRDDLAFLIERALPPSRAPGKGPSSQQPELVAMAAPDGVQIWSQGRTLATLARPVRSWPGMGMYPGLAFSPDGKKLASAQWLWNSSAPQRTLPLDAGTSKTQLIFSPDSRFLALWSWSLSSGGRAWLTAQLSVFEASSGKLLHQQKLDQAAAPRQLVLGLLSPVWLPNSSLLLAPVLGDDAAVEVVNVISGKRLRWSLAANGSVITPKGSQGLAELMNVQ
jgi:WD40 repeat protein